MILEITLILLASIAYIYWNFRQKSKYWKQRGVKQFEEVPFPWGDMPVSHPDVLQGKVNLGDVIERQYNCFKDEKLYGTYMMPPCHPVLVVKDLDLIRDVLIKDFDHFVDRNAVFSFFGTDKKTNSKNDLVWQKQMLNAKGETWKDVRSMFSPIFTSGKLKMMVQFIKIVSKKVVQEVSKAANENREIEMKDLFGKFSMDTIASCAFGVDVGSFNSGNKDLDFVANAQEIFIRHPLDNFLFFLSNVPVISDIVAWLGIPTFKPNVTSFFYDNVARTLKHRMETKTRRNDLVDLMIDAMTNDMSADLNTNLHASEQFESDARLNHERKVKGQVDELTVVATAIVLLTAGYDTTAQTLSFIAYELARNPDIQARLQEEIDSAFEDAGEDAEDLDYTVVQGLIYLDMVIHEALRRHSPSAVLNRGCVKDYKFKGTNVTIKAGQELIIPTQGIQRDERIYPNPMEFNPENFSKAAKDSRSPYAFLAFGQGPRSCIGMRFALLEAKIGLISILRSFSFTASERTPTSITRDPESLLGNILEPLYVKVVPRK